MSRYAPNEVKCRVEITSAVLKEVHVEFYHKEPHLASLSLTLYSLTVCLRTTRFNIKKFYMVLALR